MGQERITGELAIQVAKSLMPILSDIKEFKPIDNIECQGKSERGRAIDVWRFVQKAIEKTQEASNNWKAFLEKLDIKNKYAETFLYNELENLELFLESSDFDELKGIMKKKSIGKTCHEISGWKKTLIGLGVVGGLALILINLLFFIKLFPVVWVWIITMGSLIIIFMAVGHGFTGKLWGLLIDRRNMLSLSKLQMLLWTLLVISGYITLVGIFLNNDVEHPLDIGIPATLWALMGISTASLVGSPLVKNDNFGATIKNESTEINQQTERKSEAAKDAALKDLGLIDKNKDIVGTEIVNKCPEGATFADLFRGEEVGNYNQPDLGKLQMFLFTFIIWFAYAVFVYQLIAKMQPNLEAIGLANHYLLTNSTNLTAKALLNSNTVSLGSLRDFPDISSGMAGMLAISNAGYLAFKAVPREKSP
jgi:hypothetical protein